MHTTEMDDAKLYDYCGSDGSKWAEAFCQHVKKLHGVDLDEDWVTGWFANAIVHSLDLANGTAVRSLPDGSAFFVATVGD